MTEFYYKDLCHKIIGICFDVYNEFDYGYREKFYEDIIYDRFLENGITVKKQHLVKIKVSEKYYTSRKVDFLIGDKLLVELKVGKKLTKKDFEQVNEYLISLDLRLALLILFSPNGVVIRRVVNDPKYK